eukprot:TRINITY_DN2271_c0_g1_i1.p1 TRINITY_DN2271_c0_g1~~TRINITY_DN2271_c0_g1_i1.p1  ORF type:complete len:391 (+),score=44.89 TRINITY_DN2271_c0_g1_i1:46-1218(+)
MPKKLPPGVVGLQPVAPPTGVEPGGVHVVNENMVMIPKPDGQEKYTVTASGTKHENTFAYDDFEVNLSNLGCGTQGHVKLCKHKKTGKQYAMKVVNFGGDPKTLQCEISHVLRLSGHHPNLVQSYDAYFREGHLMILMDYCSNGNLANLLDAAPRPNVVIPMHVLAFMADGICKGLHHLHTHNEIHRDLKPSNILIHDDEEVGATIKICDFGLSKQVTSEFAHTKVGAGAYLSPERVQGQGYREPSDMWALGVTIAELALGDHPWLGRSGIELSSYLSGLEGKIEVTWGTDRNISPECKDFVTKCLLIDPKDRPTAEQLLSHPFITSAADKTEEARKWLLTATSFRHWVKHKDVKKGKYFYINLVTGKKQWEKPPAPPFAKAVRKKESSG